MQLGFDRYIELFYERPDMLERLLQVNEEFCVEWANAQLAAGATAICFFDPVASTSMVPRDLFLKYGLPVAKRVIARLKSAVAMHFASGRCLPILEDIMRTGALAVAVSAYEDLRELKAVCRGKLALIGNLNAIEMRRWTPAEAEAHVKECIARAGRGGGYILSDHHGEVPWQVPDETLLAIAEAVNCWGRYPLDWIEKEDGE